MWMTGRSTQLSNWRLEVHKKTTLTGWKAVYNKSGTGYVNLLKLSDDKMEFIIFGTAQLKKINNIMIKGMRQNPSQLNLSGI